MLMADHPGWVRDKEGRLRRLLCSSGAVWLVVATPAPGGGHDIDAQLVDGEPGTGPVVDIADPALLEGESELRDALLAAGPVARVRTGDLWEALVAAIFRDATPCRVPPKISVSDSTG